MRGYGTYVQLTNHNRTYKAGVVPKPEPHPSAQEGFSATCSAGLRRLRRGQSIEYSMAGATVPPNPKPYYPRAAELVASPGHARKTRFRAQALRDSRLGYEAQDLIIYVWF